MRLDAGKILETVDETIDANPDEKAVAAIGTTQYLENRGMVDQRDRKGESSVSQQPRRHRWVTWSHVSRKGRRV